MVSAWERGATRTSLGYRRMLTQIYRRPDEELFAHQDVPGHVGGPRLLNSYPTLQKAMGEVVANADRYLAVTGRRKAGGNA